MLFLFLVFLYMSYKKEEELAIRQMSRVFANGPKNRGSIPDQVIPKTQKMVLDAAFT